MRTNLLLKVGILVIIVVAFALFNSDDRPSKSPEQLRFEAWLAGLQTRIPDAVTGKAPLPAIEVAASIPPASAPYSIKLTKDPASTDQILRILEMAQVADVFSVAHDEPPSRGQYVAIRVGEGDAYAFRGYLTPAMVDDRVQIMNLLKLLQLYAVQATPVPTAVSEEVPGNQGSAPGSETLGDETAPSP